MIPKIKNFQELPRGFKRELAVDFYNATGLPLKQYVDKRTFMPPKYIDVFNGLVDKYHACFIAQLEGEKIDNSQEFNQDARNI